MKLTRADILKVPAWAAELQRVESARPRRAAAHRTGEMNGTEARYAARLGELMVAGDVLAFDFERHTLRLDTPDAGRACRYTPDFRVLHAAGPWSWDEIKGAHVRDDALVKFKWACEQFPLDWFRLWQWDGGAWSLVRESSPKRRETPAARGAPAGASREPLAPPVSRARRRSTK